MKLYERCTCGKICYPKKIDAQYALYECDFQNRQNNNHERHEKRVYFCPLCKCFHLTHQDKLPTWKNYKNKKR